MLKGISPIISPDLIKLLMAMGHGDEIVLADGNFPAASHSNHLVYGNGNNVIQYLEAILKIFPLDSYVDTPVLLMKPVEGDIENPKIFDEYTCMLNNFGIDVQIGKLDRMEFYERSKKAYAVVATSDSTAYANIILKKGVL